MIEKELLVRGSLTASYPFNGDPSKKWNCRIVDCNLGIDGDPVVNFVRNGMIDLTFQDKQLNSTFDVIFYEDSEAELSKRSESAKNLSAVMPPSLISFASKTFAYSQVFIKWMFWGVVGLVIAASLLTALSYKYNMTGVFDFWEEWNAARIAKSAKVVIDETIKDMSDEFYTLPGVKIIEEREGIKFKDLFAKVSEDVYLMEDLFVDVENDPVLMTWGDLEDKCDSLGGLIPTNSELSFFVTGKLTESADTWADYPEWARDGAGAFSDDYAVYSKSNDPEALVDQEAYQKTEIWWADNGDALFAGRCIIYKTTFTD